MCFTDQSSRLVEIENQTILNLFINCYFKYKMRDSVESRYQMFRKSYGFLYFVDSIGENIDKKLIKRKVKT